MVGFTLHMGYGRWGRNPFTDEGEHVKVRIFRISQVPTVEMYMNNLSRWSPGYNGSLSSEGRDIGGNEHWLHDNGLPVDFCWLTASFFLISAVFHLWALLVGIFERTWFLYWRKLDDCFAYWRWAEYSASASVMAMAIAISVGLREQSILAGIFMCATTLVAPPLMLAHSVCVACAGSIGRPWQRSRFEFHSHDTPRTARLTNSLVTWQAFGFLVGYAARPTELIDTTPHYRPVGAYEFGLWGSNNPPPKPDERYRNDPSALKLISQVHWTLDRQWRMVPHIFGWFTMTAAWVVIIVRPCSFQTRS